MCKIKNSRRNCQAPYREELVRIHAGKNCGLSQSTIGGWYRSHQTPTIQTLDKICRGLGITLSQFFAEDGDPVSLTREERDMLDVWCALPPQKRRLVVELLRNP